MSRTLDPSSRGVTTIAAEVGQAVEPLVGRGDLRLPGGERLVDQGRVAGRRVEVQVVVLGRPEQPGYVAMAPQRPVEPVVLHPRHVPDQAEQAHRGRRHGAGGELLRREPLALEAEGEPVVGEVLADRRQLADRAAPLDARGSSSGRAHMPS